MTLHTPDQDERSSRSHNLGLIARRAPLVAGALALVLASGAGGAVAGSLITSQQIQDYTIKGRDLSTGAVVSRVLKDRSVQVRDLTLAARAALRGQPGAAGTRWLTGAGAPAAVLAAKDGDWYLDSDGNDVYALEDGSWSFVVNIRGIEGAAGATGAQGEKGANGATGADGKAGSVWLSGRGAPTARLGQDGDWYLDTASGRAHQKVAGAWGLRVNLQGVRGEKGEAGADGGDGLDGATWHAGTAAPDGSVGSDGDLYLDVTTSNVHRRAAGTWALLTNIKGQKGDPGIDGIDGIDGIAGADGTDGAPGADGADGQDGAPGAAWHTGAGHPDASTGRIGDLHLNVSNNIVSQKVAGGWAVVANLTGPVGPEGQTGPAGPQGQTGPAGPQGPSGSTGAYGGFSAIPTPVTVTLAGTELPLAGTGFATGMGANSSRTQFTVASGGAYRISYTVGTTAPVLVGTRVLVNGGPDSTLTLQPSASSARFADEAIVRLAGGSTVSLQLFGLLGMVTVADAGLVIQRVGD